MADRVFLSDPEAARALGARVTGDPVEVLLTVDLGDRREGVLPDAAAAVAAQLTGLPGISLAGIAVNFACLSGQLPSQELFREAEDVLASVADDCAAEPLLSLGGTCVLQHLEGYAPRFATEIRSGGGPLYGYDFVSGKSLAGLERFDPVLTAVVLESSRKPPAPPGTGGFDAFGHVPDVDLPDHDANYALLNLGRRDCEPGGLRPLLPGARLAGATSDVSVLITEQPLRPGDTVAFAVDYDALVRAMTSPFVAKEFIARDQVRDLEGRLMTQHAEGRYVGPRRPLRILGADDVERIHEASLDVLASVGVMFHSQRALDVLEAHGAIVDRETTVARIPAEAVEQAVSTLPRTFTLGGRTPEFDLPIDGEHVYLASDGCATFVREADGTVRPSTRQDVYDAARVVEGLPNLSATSALVSAQDAPNESRVLHEFDACMRASRKHSIVVSIKDAAEAKPLIRMAEAVAGGSAELKARPTFSVILCTVSPLHQERFGMELAFELAEAGIPMMLYPMPILGATAPVTPAGTAVVNNTEILAAITAVQLACPGAKIVHAGGPDGAVHAHRRPTSPTCRRRSCCAPRRRRWRRATACRPASAGAAPRPSSPRPSPPTRTRIGMLLEFLAGADFLFGAGLLDSVQQMSLEELVIADEVFGMVTRLVRGVEVDRETLAVDLIKKLGFRGDYLFEPHTRAHVRELWQARLGETGTYESWKNAGSPRLEDKARAVADGILASPAGRVPRGARPRLRRDHRGGRSRPSLKGVIHGLRRQVLRREARQARAALPRRREADPRGDARRHRERRRQVPLAQGARHPRGQRRHRGP